MAFLRRQSKKEKIDEMRPDRPKRRRRFSGFWDGVGDAFAGTIGFFGDILENIEIDDLF